MSALLNMLLRLSLTGGVTCLVCLTASALLRNKMPKAWLYCLWLVVTISFLVPAPINLRLPVPQIRFPAASDSSASVPADGALGKSTSNTAFSVQDPAAIQPPIDKQSQMPAKGPSGININTGLIIAVIWMAGAGGMFLWFVTGYCLTAGKLKKGRDLLTAGRIPVYENAATSTPLLVGLFRPVVYLPKDFKNPELAVRHELCHWHRGDIWSKWFVQLTVCIHWFNPMAYLMKRELNRLSELACDEAVIRDMDEAGRQAYGQMLLDTLRVSSDLGGPMLAVLGSKKQWLRERLLGIMDKRLVTKKSAVALAALTLGIVGTAVVSGGFLAGCSGTGTGNQESAEQAIPSGIIGINNVSPSPSASDASPDISPSSDDSTGKVYFWDGKDGVIPHDKSEKIFDAGITRDATSLNDTEISTLVGYKVVFPEKLGNGFELLYKTMSVDLGKKVDYATTYDHDLNNDMYMAILNDSAFIKLAEYDPFRNCIVTYIDDKWKEIYISVAKTEDVNKVNLSQDPITNSATADADSINYIWHNVKVPTTAGRSELDPSKPIELESQDFLSWSVNGLCYSMSFLNPNQITPQEAIEFAKAFMEAQSDKGGASR